jgi:hypothetical protein
MAAIRIMCMLLSDMYPFFVSFFCASSNNSSISFDYAFYILHIDITNCILYVIFVYEYSGRGCHRIHILKPLVVCFKADRPV